MKKRDVKKGVVIYSLTILFLMLFIVGVSAADLKISNNWFSKTYSDGEWCEGSDINQDGVVDIKDIRIFNKNLDRTDCFEKNCQGADINKDGVVNDDDSVDLFMNLYRDDCVEVKEEEDSWIVKLLEYLF